jgi:hypothetical protein
MSHTGAPKKGQTQQKYVWTEEMQTLFDGHGRPLRSPKPQQAVPYLQQRIRNISLGHA